VLESSKAVVRSGGPHKDAVGAFLKERDIVLETEELSL
jgi:hypothetical protein